MKKLIITLPLVLLVILGFQPASGQGFDATSMGMGGAYGAVARGVSAIPWNPANLALPRDGWLEINFVGLNANLANSSLNISNYERYFTQIGHNGTWTEDDITSILELIPDEGLDASVEVNANALGVAFGRYGISAQLVGQAKGLIPRAPVELVLRGNLKEKYNIGQLDGNGYAAVKISAAASYPIKIKRYFDDFAVGLNLNYYRALAYTDVTEASGGFVTTFDHVQSDIKLTGRLAEGGSGFGADIGAAGVINKKLTISMSLQNVLGSINWNDQPQEFMMKFNVDSADFTNIEIVQDDTTYNIDPFSTRLPVVLHLGTAYELKEYLTLALDMVQAFTDGMGYSDQAKLSIGAEYRPTEIVPIRTGLTFGGKWGYAMGVGIGFHLKALQFDFAYNMHRALLPALSKGISVGFNVKIVI